MPIHQRFIGRECVDEYEASAKGRIESGFKLLADDDANGVAFLAEAVEMFLKASYFSFVKRAGTDPIGRIDLDAARREANLLGVTVPHDGYHNLSFWAELLITKRASLPAVPPLSAAVETAVRNASSRLMENWNIVDRYRYIQPLATRQDLLDVFEDAMTISTKYDALRK